MIERPLSSLELVPGQRLDNYRIEYELGRGAMSVVYLATQLDLGRQVAFKLLLDQYANEQEFINRFLNEAKTVAILPHPGVIRALDAGRTPEGLVFFAMEYVDGTDLQSFINKDGKIEPGKAIRWFTELAMTLDYGWKYHGFIHGDLKPGNVMINRFGHVKLADFGLAHVRERDYEVKTLMLTPHYAAPELIRGEVHLDNCRSDIYAFGGTLYHVLAGTPPFPGSDTKAVLDCHLHKQAEPLCRRNPAIRQDISDAIGAMMAKNPDERPQDWTAVLNTLKRLGRP